MDNELPIIEGINTEKGLVHCGGSLDAYVEVLESFLEDSTAKIREMKPFQKKNITALNDTELHHFASSVHSIKGVAAIIGVQGLSKKAAGLEKAAKVADRKIIQRDFPGFFEDLKATTQRVQSFLKNNSGSEV